MAACPILAKTEYLTRHNNVCQYLHWHICKSLGVPDTANKWYDHQPNPVTTINHHTVLYDQQVHTDRTIMANRPDIILRDGSKQMCLLIDVSVPCDGNVVNKDAEKKLKYKSLAIEVSRMWGMKTEVVPIVIGALGIVPLSLPKNLSKLPGLPTVCEVQEIALLGTANILRKVL